MNIAIFSKKESISVKLLRQAIEKRGHNITHLKNLYLEPNNLDKIKITENIDLVYYWNGAGTIGRVCVCDYFHNNGIKVVNSGIFLDPCLVNKIYQSYRVGKNDILAPQTITQTSALYAEIIERIGSPFILKSSTGSCGKKVYLIKDEKKYNEATEELKGQELLYQKFIPNDGDYRVHVIGHKAVAVYKRVPHGNDFRANVSQGGSMEKVTDQELVKKLFAIAEKVSTSFKGTEIIGVDLIKHAETGEIFFIETNELPGIKQVHEVTGINVADKMVDYFEETVK